MIDEQNVCLVYHKYLLVMYSTIRRKSGEILFVKRTGRKMLNENYLRLNASICIAKYELESNFKLKQIFS